MFERSTAVDQQEDDEEDEFDCQLAKEDYLAEPELYLSNYR